jgi:periplasmic protein TonB
MSTPHPDRERIDPIRTAGISGTLALHLALGLLLPATSGESAAPAAAPDPAFDIVWIPPAPPPPPPPPPPDPPIPPTPPPRAQVPPAPAPPPPVPEPSAWRVPVETPPVAPREFAPVSPPSAPADPAGEGPIAVGELAYAHMPPPPPYPGPALRARQQGTVLLRIVVDEAGKPVEVEVARSSGHRALDRAAVDYALRQLRFRPALRDGRPVRAVAQVPVAFRLPGSA